MSVVFIALPIALLLALAALFAFIWSVKSGQMDDLETPGYRVLFDDEGGSRDRGRSRDSGSDGDSDDKKDRKRDPGP